MPITIKLFAHYRDLLGQSEMKITARPGMTVAEVYDETVGVHASADLRRSTLFALNESYVPADTRVHDGDRIAFIPPVSGG